MHSLAHLENNKRVVRILHDTFEDLVHHYEGVFKHARPMDIVHMEAMWKANKSNILNSV